MRNRGYVFLDALVAMTILGLLLVTMSLATASERRALERLSDTRQAQRTAETELLLMQAGQSSPLPDGVIVQKLPDSSDVSGMVWTQMHSTVNGRPVDLIGLVPQSAIPSENGGR
jgi:type II secretory pathway pseudopilin PulG